MLVILLEIFSLTARSSAENFAKSSADVICRAFSCAILFGPIPLILVSSVGGLLGSSAGAGFGAGGFPSSIFVSTILGGKKVLYFFGRAEYPDATQNMPNRSRTIIKATGINVTPQKGIIKAARMKQTIPKK